MPKTGRVVFVARTPAEQRISRTLTPVLDWAAKMLLDRGHWDGFSVTLSLEVMEGELPEDTEWLGAKLGE